MKTLILITLISLNVYAGQACDVGRDCEVVKVVTRCDVDKQALRNKIHKLEEELAKQKEKYNALYYQEKQVVEKEVVKTEVVYQDRVKIKERKVVDNKHHTLSLMAINTVTGVSASTSGNTASAQANTGYSPGAMYQYRFDAGFTPAIGVSFSNSQTNLFGGLGWSF
jgi:hypothetical protein